jgi:hypothetical protein
MAMPVLDEIRQRREDNARHLRRLANSPPAPPPTQALERGAGHLVPEPDRRPARLPGDCDQSIPLVAGRVRASAEKEGLVVQTVEGRADNSQTATTTRSWTASCSGLCPTLGRSLLQRPARDRLRDEPICADRLLGQLGLLLGRYLHLNCNSAPGYVSLMGAHGSNEFAFLRSGVALGSPGSPSSVTVRSSTTTRPSARQNAGSSQPRIDRVGKKRRSIVSVRNTMASILPVQGIEACRPERAPSHHAPPRGALSSRVRAPSSVRSCRECRSLR